MELPNRERRRVSGRKVAAYLLDLDHPDGGPKARFFRAFGFDEATLEEALMRHPELHPVDATLLGRHGRKYVIRCSLPSPDGRDPCILSVWILRTDGVPDLVTAYPA